jgi:pimeloyl-ACP methyl ester carboxylesterase
VTREIVGETRARLEAAQAAKISVPILLLIGEESTDPARREVGADAAALPDARLLVLAGQQHIADILDPENVAKHLLEFLHRPARAPVDCLVRPLVTGSRSAIGVAPS